ncbi:MAG TPA: YkgJ family cysteine cluster protein [Phycisphaerae bacterium]|nr:YkgJ family cysteine cluster protein [Phycisphaerae bacterium]
MTLSLADRILQPNPAPAAHRPNSNDAFTAAMREFYEAVDASIAAQQPVCINRGDCCKFAAFGHRLYVTDVELAYFVRGEPARLVDPNAGACPYQEAGRCTAREHRPLGCRIFFCDENARDWQGPEYERHLERLKEIGRGFDIPYRYREWLSALTHGMAEVVAHSPSPLLTSPQRIG